MQRPNILFVFADQMRSTALGCAGVEDVRTPCLDEFARQGTRFSNAISNTPLCSPARASLLTGLHTLAHRVVNNDILMDLALPTVAQALNGSGYDCAYIGKWHLDEPDRASSFRRDRAGADSMTSGPSPTAITNTTQRSTTCRTKATLAGSTTTNRMHRPIWPWSIWRPIRHSQALLPVCLLGPPHCPYLTAPRRFQQLYDPAKIHCRSPR